jgi:hypothetical protein
LEAGLPNGVAIFDPGWAEGWAHRLVGGNDRVEHYWAVDGAVMRRKCGGVAPARLCNGQLNLATSDAVRCKRCAIAASVHES